MGANPRVVTQERHITWDGVTQRLPRGQVLDVPPGSALEREIGADFLAPLPGSAAAQVPDEGPAPEEKPGTAPARPRAAAKAGDAREGDS